jgi:hypothetical protein
LGLIQKQDTKMLGTIVIEKYKKTETSSILADLERLILENSSDWSTAGIYCYWDYYKKQVLYIGLAVDLIERFKQHNGIVECLPNSCKLDRIKEYFEINEYLGFTIILQSQLSQPFNNRQKRKYKGIYSDSELKNILGKEGAEDIKYTEGVLIEAHKTKHGKRPSWNKIGGSAQAQRIAKNKNVKMLEYLITNEQNKYTSLVSLKELSNSSLFNKYEAYLHSLRTSILPVEAMIKEHEKLGIETYREMRSDNYFSTKLEI